MGPDVAGAAEVAQDRPAFPSYEVRGQGVALDSDLARLFGVPIFRLNGQLKRKPC